MRIWDKIHFSLWSVKMFVLENVYFMKYKAEWEKSKQFQNIHDGKRCFVLGNGPSLNKYDLDLLKKNNEITFCSNRIYKMFDQTDWRPMYYAVCDQKLFLDNQRDIESIDSSIMFFPLDFIPFLSKKSRYFYFARYPFKFFTKYPKFSNEISRVFGEGNTITYHLIQLAACMGFKEIYLLGCDFSYNIAIGADGKIIKARNQKNYPWEEETKPSVLPNLQANLYAYMAAKEYGDKAGIKIYNATRGGKLEVFPRISLEEVFDEEKNTK